MLHLGVVNRCLTGSDAAADSPALCMSARHQVSHGHAKEKRTRMGDRIPLLENTKCRL